jgi:hypothetical protein
VQRLLAGEHASHLCGEAACVNPDHIVVESKDSNESRKYCQKDFFTGFITIGNKEVRVDVGTNVCSHAVSCVRRYIAIVLGGEGGGMT